MYKHVHAIGDSHVLHMGGIFHTHHIADGFGQGATAHNLIEDESSTDSKRKVAEVLDSLPPESIVVLSFGEVDCRIHIRDEEMAEETVSRYAEAVRPIADRFRTIVFAPIGAVPQDAEGRLPQDERAKLTARYNSLLTDALEGVCEVVDIGASENGRLKDGLTDDGVHLNALGESLVKAWARTAGLGPEARNAVWSTAALSTHSTRIAKVLGWPLFIETPIGDDIDTAYIIGMYDIPDYDYTLAMTARAKNRIIHWCGGDVQHLTHPDMLPDAVHLCESVGLRDELLAKGIEATVCTLPTTIHANPVPLPPERIVTFYSGTNAEKYGASVVRFLMDAIPDAEWVVYSLGQYDDSQMRALIESSRVHVRFTDHDGGVGSAREYLEGGRRVVTTADVPYGVKVSKADPVGIVRAVRKALDAAEPYYEASDFYKGVNDPERFLAEFEEATR